MNLRYTSRLGLLFTFLLLAWGPGGSELLAQQTGAVSGTVQAAGTLEPLGSVQVFVPDTDIGTITDEDGSFRLDGVPTGQQTLRARLIGYRMQERTVNVRAGEVATVAFELGQSAIELEQIVVTGTGTGGVERKKLGNTIATIETSQLENAPTGNFSELMAGREPGISVLPSSGLAGEGSSMRVRGSSSLSQSNEPIVYVDGVRVNSGGGFGGDVSAGAVGAGASSRLDDIDPSSIERVEVLKGAAAATLYGTEASNGVIQIFTRSGQEGGTRWTFKVEQGFESMPTGRLIPHADFARDVDQDGDGIIDITAEEQAAQMNDFWNADVEPYEVLQRDILSRVDETGSVSTLSGTVSGGSPGITYFISGRFQNHNGIYALQSLGPAVDENKRINATANLNVFPSDELRVRLRTNFAQTDQKTPDTSNNIFAPFPLMFHSQLRFANEDNIFGTPVFATVRESMQRQTGQEVDHFGGSLGLTFLPSDRLTLNGTFGIDITSNNSNEVIPFGWNVDNFTGSNVEGFRQVASVDQNEITLDIQAGWEAPLGDEFTSSFTAGTQGFLTETSTRGGSGAQFPGPGFNVVEAGAIQGVDESFLQNVNVGVFAQEQVGYRDVAFLTVGARFDANSAFGENFAGVLYPKASFSVIPSDLSGWDNETLSTLRFRGAIGQSGLQPGAFDEFRTFSALPSTEGPGIEPANLGNPDLKPEISTEWELGAELGLFGDRAAVEFTYWDRVVNDALVSKQFPVSGGFNQLQLANIGQLEGSGIDLVVEGNVYSGDDVSVDVFANAAYLSEEVTDLGGAPPLKTGGSYPRNLNYIREGYAPGSFFGAELADAAIPLNLAGDCAEPSEADALAYFSQPRDLSEFEVLQVGCGTDDYLDQYLGKPTPDWQGSIGADITFLDRFELRSLFEYKAGNFFIQDLSGAFRQSNALIGRNTPATAEIASTVLDPSSTARERLDAAILWAREYRALAPMSGLNQVWPADFIRWRELSLTYDAPDDFAEKLSFRNLSVSLQARNLALWVNDDYRGIDPELNNNARCNVGDLTGTAQLDCNFLLGQEAWRIPIPRRFSLAVRFGF